MNVVKAVIVPVFLIVFLVVGCNFSQTLFEKGKVISVEEKIRTDVEAVIGDVENEGIAVNIPENTFDEDVNVILNTIPEHKLEDFTTEGFELFGSPISIKVEGRESIRLNQPASVTVSIPQHQLELIESMDDIYVAYYNKNKWEYFIPDTVDLEEGKIQFTTYHFSPYASGKLSRDKQLEHFAQQMAVQSWAKSHTEQKFTDATKEYFYDLFENKLGITDNDVKGKILRNIVKENDFGDLMVNLEKGDLTSFGTKLGEMTGKVILNQAQLDPGFMSKWVSISSTGAKAAAHAYEGDYKEAMKEISLAIMDQHMVGKIFKAGVEATDAAIKNWKKKSIEDAFQAYKKGADGEHGYYVDAGDFKALANQMRGIMHKIYSDAIDAYCKKHNLDENKLDKSVLDKIRADTEKKLETEFSRRVSEDAKIEQHKAVHMKIIKAFENSLLLKKGSFGYDYDLSLERRVERLHIVMENILEQTGMKLNTQLIDSTDSEMSLDDLCTLIGVWYNDRTKMKENYFAKLEEMGFIKKAAHNSEDENVWVLVNVVDDDGEEYISSHNKSYKGVYETEANYGRNNFSIKSTYVGKTDTYYDPDKVHGENITYIASFSKPPEVIKAGDKISINLSLSPSGNNLSFFAFSGSARGQLGKNNSRWLDFINEDKKHFFKSYSKNNYASFNEIISAVAPGGREGDTMKLKFHLYSGGKLETTYVYEWNSLNNK